MQATYPPVPKDCKLIEEINGFEQYKGYMIDTCGNVYSCKKQCVGNAFTDHWFVKAKKPNNGYLLVSLSFKDKAIYPKIHRLVAQAFLPNPNNLPQVNHKNGIKTDNRVENLEWCDASHNVKHAINKGLRDTAKGERITHSKLKCDDIIKIFERKIDGQPNWFIASHFGIDTSCVCRIINRVSWRHVDVEAGLIEKAQEIARQMNPISRDMHREDN